MDNGSQAILSDREVRRAQEYARLIDRASARAVQSEKIAQAKEARKAQYAKFEGLKLHRGVAHTPAFF